MLLGEPGAGRSVIWWETAPDLAMNVDCEGAGHRLRWRRGQVELLDHPELDAELAMIALGGPEPTCLAYHRLWVDAVADGGFLAEWVEESRLSPSWFSWLAMALERMRSEGFHEFLRGLPPARAQRMGEFLHRYPVPWIDRAAASVGLAVAEVDGVACLDAPRLLSAAVAQRLRRAFVASIGGRQLALGAAALVPLRISVTSGAAPSINGALIGPDRGVDLAVDRSWLHRVWAGAATVIDGSLVVAIESDEHRSPDTTALASMVIWRQSGDRGWRPSIEQRVVRYVDGSWQTA